MDQVLKMLTGAAFDDLTKMQMDVANIANLTLAKINAIMHSGGARSSARSARSCATPQTGNDAFLE
jgi:hypothetical protein